jgi:hypothetical protein
MLQVELHTGSRPIILGGASTGFAGGETPIIPFVGEPHVSLLPFPRDIYAPDSGRDRKGVTLAILYPISSSCRPIR